MWLSLGIAVTAIAIVFGIIYTIIFINPYAVFWAFGGIIFLSVWRAIYEGMYGSAYSEDETAKSTGPK